MWTKTSIFYTRKPGEIRQTPEVRQTKAKTSMHPREHAISNTIKLKVIKEAWPEENLWYLRDSSGNLLGLWSSNIHAHLYGKKACCKRLKKSHELFTNGLTSCGTLDLTQQPEEEGPWLNLPVKCSSLIQWGMKSTPVNAALSNSWIWCSILICCNSFSLPHIGDSCQRKIHQEPLHRSFSLNSS